MNSQTTLQSEVLYTSPNGKWTIEKLNDREICITDGWSICYAYLSKCGNKIVVDRKNYPKYIETEAIKQAKKHIKSIYND